MILEDLVRVAPDGRHIAYEPLPAFASELQAAFPAVDVRAKALADENGERTFTHVVGNPGYSGFRQRPTPHAEAFVPMTVEVERLDDALPDAFRPAFIKIDVEGAELEVLRGALETLRPTGRSSRSSTAPARPITTARSPATCIRCSPAMHASGSLTSPVTARTRSPTSGARSPRAAGQLRRPLLSRDRASTSAA